MEIVSVGPIEDGPRALGREIAAVAKRIPGRKLGIVYLPIDVDHRAFLEEAQEALGGVVVGATTGGAAFTERGHTRTGAVAGVFGGPGFDFAVEVAGDLSQDVDRAIRGACSGLVDRSRRLLTRSQSVLTLSDAFATQGDRLFQALQSATPPHWHHFGGTAGDNWKFQRTHVFYRDQVLSDAAILVGLFSESAPSLAVHHGWCAAPDSREFTITDIEGNVLRTLDDRPAAEVYAEELRRLGLIADGDPPLQSSATYELGARTMYGELKIRAPLAVGPDGSVTLAAGLPRGTIVRVVTATPDQLIDAARELSRRALYPLAGRPVRGALIFDCAARLQVLQGRYSEQTDAFLGGRNFPVVGLAGYGEIAKFAGSVEGFHNTTAVMAAW
jgi:hypothetical protein